MTAQIEQVETSPTLEARAPLDVASEATTHVIRPSAEQARDAILFVPVWLNRVRAAGGRHVVIDMSQVDRLDLSGFGVLLAKLRDVLHVTVKLSGIGISETVSLRSLGLLDGVSVENRRRRPQRRTAPHGGR